MAMGPLEGRGAPGGGVSGSTARDPASLAPRPCPSAPRSLPGGARAGAAQGQRTQGAAGQLPCRPSGAHPASPLPTEAVAIGLGARGLGFVPEGGLLLSPNLSFSGICLLKPNPSPAGGLSALLLGLLPLEQRPGGPDVLRPAPSPGSGSGPHQSVPTSRIPEPAAPLSPPPQIQPPAARHPQDTSSHNPFLFALSRFWWGRGRREAMATCGCETG